MENILYLVIPCYNEEEVLPETASRLSEKVNSLIRQSKIDERSRIIFVNDGSKDHTWEIIRALHQKDRMFGGINLSRNRGHQNALLAGLMTVREYADAVISMDADLQDDINAIDEMIDKYLSGTDIVYGVRSSRKRDTLFKKATAEGFYKIMNAMGANTVFNHADYRLMSRRALEGLAEYGEVNLFLRGIVPMIGYSADIVYYERGERFAGESKYPLGKMLSLAVEGVTSLSTKPLRLITGLGFLIFIVSIGMLIYSLVRHFTGATIVGWTTLMVSIWAIGGLILLSLGVVGEYIGKIYLETKARPRFIVEEFLNEKNEEMDGNKVEEKLEKKETLKFSESGIHPDILRAVSEMGFENMTPIQEQSIPVLLDGKDIIGQAQTGTGKTAAFAIPMIQNIDPEIKKPQGIILCPTRELAMQAAEEIRRLAKYMHGVKVLPVYGGQDIGRQIRALGQGVQIIVGTPGRVMDHLRRHTIKTAGVKMIVLDEADEMLDMGFREDIETVLSDMPEAHQMALFSATMPQEILDIAGSYQNSAVYIRVTPEELTVSAIKQAYYRVAKKDKVKALCRLLDYYQPARSLIFCNTKRMVDEIAGNLKDKGYEAEGLHGDLSQNQRDTVMNLFRGGRCAILIATDVAARGIDVSGVDAVFNYDVPEDIEYYVHRIGRTGRAGRKGRSFTLISGREIFKIRSIEKVCHTTIRERKLPSPEDIVRVKAEKLFVSAMEVMDSRDLTEVKASIEKTAEERGFTVIDLAAAFMQMNMGESPEEIEEEKPYPERSRRDAADGRRRRGGRDFGRSRDDRYGREDRSGRRRDDKYPDRSRSGKRREDKYPERDRSERKRDDRYTSYDKGPKKGKDDRKKGRQNGKKVLDDMPLGRLLGKRK